MLGEMQTRGYLIGMEFYYAVGGGEEGGQGASKSLHSSIRDDLRGGKKQNACVR